MEVVKLICATGYGGLRDKIFQSFEDCQSFTMIKMAGREIRDVKIFPNRAIGIDRKMQTIQFIIQLFPDIVVAGNFEEQSKNMFSKANIKTFISFELVEEAICKVIVEQKESDDFIKEQKTTRHEFLSSQIENSEVYPDGGKKDGLEHLSREDFLAILKRKEEFLLSGLDKIRRRIKELESDV